MKHQRISLALALGLLLTLAALSLWGTALSSRRLREREEARRQVTEALANREAPERTAKLFRQAQDFDEAYAACEEGARLESQGRFAEAAESFRACVDADPGLAAARLAWAEALLNAHGRPAYEEVREDLRRFVETAHLNPDTDREALQPLQDLLLDLEDLLAANLLDGRLKEWTEEEILEILTRDTRSPSPYDGPRVPLRLDFRPGEAYLGKNAKQQLDRVVRALKDGTLIHAVIQIEGYTDRVEARTRAERLALARRRARAVYDYLCQNGIPSDRLRIAALAEDYPLDSGGTEENLENNRRVELFNLETKQRLWKDVRTPR
jgi:outer membrane protein OmpA-like peptidoglycan-associated protein